MRATTFSASSNIQARLALMIIIDEEVHISYAFIAVIFSTGITVRVKRRAGGTSFILGQIEGIYAASAGGLC